MRDARSLFLRGLADSALWVLMTPLAFGLRLGETWPQFGTEMLAVFLIGLVLKPALVLGMGLHRHSWSRASLPEVKHLVRVIGLGTLLMTGIAFFLHTQLVVPRSVPLIEGLLALATLGGARMLVRIYFEERRRHRRQRTKTERVLIAGAGEAGTLFAREVLQRPESEQTLVGFLDDDPVKQRQMIRGLPVLGGIDALPRVVAQHRVDVVLIAMPSGGGSVVRRVVHRAREAGVKHRILPDPLELLTGKVPISRSREVALEDLLRRDPVRLDVSGIREYLRGRVLLVTGAGGSIGAEIVRQVVLFEPRQVLLLGRGENSIFRIAQEGARHWPEVPCMPIIADIRDQARLAWVFDRYRPEVVFHAAAHKHVPLMEANPGEAVLNNVGGTRHLVDLALACGVSRFVNISTDKAVRPASVMGATKRVAEYLVESGSRRASPTQCFVSVRFGNVLGSRGSVIPLFTEQIRQGGPVTVTHPEMQRYFMTIPEAVQLVLQAASLGQNGNVYVLDMGAPIRVVDLARDLILLSGLQPDVDIPITFTGIRPGEKLFEELLTAEEGTVPSPHEKIFVARKTSLPEDRLDPLVDDLLAAATRQDEVCLRALLAALIPTHMLNGQAA